MILFRAGAEQLQPAAHRRPAMIAQCSSAEDVASAIRFAREENLEIAVRGGGHSFRGVMGWLSRKAGLSCDNLVSARVVTADGRIVNASAGENTDLHWALRGGGGNFGVVTEFEFALHEVGPLVNLGLFFWSIDMGAEALQYIRECIAALPDGAIATIAEHFPRKASPMSIMPIFPMGGAFHDVADADTAFGGSRALKWVVNIAATAPAPDLLATDRAWVRSFWDALQPFASGSGSYVNFIADTGDEERVRASYGAAKYERLARIKAEYDPDNVFHKNANIKPAVSV